MLGDWVKDRFGDIKQVMKLKYRRVTLDSKAGFYENEEGTIEGVPLTGDILNNIGFRRVDFDYEIDDNFYLSHCKYKEGYRLFSKDSNYNEVPLKYINYVHELQHILKDCEITKEINL